MSEFENQERERERECAKPVFRALLVGSSGVRHNIASNSRVSECVCECVSESVASVIVVCLLCCCCDTFSYFSLLHSFTPSLLHSFIPSLTHSLTQHDILPLDMSLLSTRHLDHRCSSHVGVAADRGWFPVFNFNPRSR